MYRHLYALKLPMRILKYSQAIEWTESDKLEGYRGKFTNTFRGNKTYRKLKAIIFILNVFFRLLSDKSVFASAGNDR